MKTPSLAFFISLSIASVGFSVGQALADHAVGDTTGASLLGSPPNLTSIDPSGGSSRMSYDFAIPPGRAGLQPQLTLSYNSGNSDASPYGRGWFMSLPFIRRSTRYGEPSFTCVPLPEIRPLFKR